MRRVEQRLEPVAVLRDGVEHAIVKHSPFPNPDSGSTVDLDKLVVRDCCS
jgi:hypothetical protein